MNEGKKWCGNVVEKSDISSLENEFSDYREV